MKEESPWIYPGECQIACNFLLFFVMIASIYFDLNNIDAIKGRMHGKCFGPTSFSAQTGSS
ncbi:hypothetical protein KSD_54080 [Ktedonobacter sp. SOSP1-85]|nr:hypothetical protein KSD_54080 [Ktedonobacter sp. SOSP1-85]